MVGLSKVACAGRVVGGFNVNVSAGTTAVDPARGSNTAADFDPSIKIFLSGGLFTTSTCDASPGGVGAAIPADFEPESSIRRSTGGASNPDFDFEPAISGAGAAACVAGPLAGPATG